MELVTSMGIMVILVGATTSAVLMSSHALPDGRSPSDRLVRANDVLDRMAGELFYATSMTKTAANGLVFTVDDRNHGDPGPETIRYDWSGTPGDPLTRQYNSGVIQEIVEDVKVFALSYELTTTTKQGSPTKDEGTETLLVDGNTAVDLKDFAVEPDKWIGAFFLPTLPNGAVNWSVARVKLSAQQDGNPSGLTMVQLRLPTAENLPSADIVEEVSLAESDLLDTFSWVDIPYSGVSGLSPDQGLCLVLEHVQDAKSCRVQYDNNAPLLANTEGLWTTDGGATWSASSTQRLLFQVYGTVTTTGTAELVEVSCLSGAHIRLDVGEGPTVRVQTVVQIPNMPEVSGL